MLTADGQPSIEPIIRGLSCRAGADVLGRSFQGRAAVRRITVDDHRILSAAANYLPLERRARILPEGPLEAALTRGDSDAARRLIRAAETGIAAERREYLYSQAPARNRQIVEDLQALYHGKCQICSWDPRRTYRANLCHGHHMQWLSRGGDDAMNNMVLVCPNHHAAIHRCDAPFDFQDMAFVFWDRRVRLQVDLHLQVPDSRTS